MGIVPELYCSDFDASLEFYTSLCGFSIDYSRDEERWYRRGAIEVGNLQFVAMDPDGYLLRFAQDLGQREGSET